MIKMLLFGGIVTLAFISCGGPEPTPGEKPASIDSFVTVTEQPDTVLFWTVNSDAKEKVRVYKDTSAVTNPVSVINGLKSIYPNVELELVKSSRDTIYVHIANAQAVTDDMGSFGAGEYLATVVLNLTSLPNINYVNFDFVAGSHAAPGVFAKEQYRRFTVKED